MQVSKSRLLIFGLALVFGFSSCKKKINETVVYDNVIYDLDQQDLYQSNVEKTKQKSPAQFISILYADLYGTSMPNTQLLDLNELSLSIGDKVMFNELLLSDWVNDAGSAVPTDAVMRADIDQFIEDTYLRFFLRYPTAYEQIYLKSQIEGDPDLSPALVFTAFATSNEYQFY